ncbi:MAG: rhomboid family intramembrane serine protease [Myxococcales bacterium]|nr:rhomboid family intramembrane serine protease [Myxococcales bacterium]
MNKEPFRPGPATLTTAALLVIVFVLEVALSGDEVTGLLAPSIQVLVALGGISKDFLFDQHQWWRLVAGPLLHADLVHLVLNGLVLVFAGFLVESMVGKLRWVAIYGLGALCGGLLSALLNPANIVSVGASGAGMALLAAVFVLAFSLPEPQARSGMQVNALRFLVPSLLPIATSRSGGHIDFAAHLGGALGGALVSSLFLFELKRAPAPTSPEEFVSSGKPEARLFTALVAPLAAALVAFTAAGIAFTARDAPALMVLQNRAKPSEWLGWLRSACGLDSPLSCVVLGKALARGDGVPRDAEAARALLTPACAARDVDGCFELGALEYDAKHLAPAATAWNTACDLGEPAACRNQALALSDLRRPEDEPTIRARLQQACPTVPAACADLASRIFEEDAPTAVKLAAQACDGKDAFGCWLSARFLADGTGVEKDQGKARALHQQACDLGDVRGCNSLALFLQRGWGGDVDLARAATLLDKACTTGDAQSCANFAISLWQGKGIAKDEVRALELFEMTCAAGNSGGCDGVAEMVPPDGRPAKQALFEKACAAGAASGCLYQGAGLEHSQPQDFAGAAKLYREACELGDEHGCAWYADLLKKGQGAEQDVAMAGEFYRRACEGGLEAACGK